MVRMLARERATVVGLLLLNALLFTLHHSVGTWINRGDYTPLATNREISYLVYDETYYYAAGAQKFLRSGYLGGEIAIYEKRGEWSPLLTIHAPLFGGLARLTGSVE